MHLAVLTLVFQLPGCSSLKEKRHRLLGIKDKFGKIANVAVSEANYHDNLRRAEWHFAVLSQDKTIVEQQIAHIENFASTELDAVLEKAHREWL